MNRPMSSPAYCRPTAYLAFAEQLPHLDTTRGLFRAAFAIAQHERLEDGRYNIVLRAQSRFRVLEEHEGEPYRLATVETLSDEPGDASALEGLRRRVLATIARAADGPKSLVLQGELPHELLVNALSQSLGLRPVEKQSLLGCDTLEARYARLIEILEFHILEGPAGTQHSIH